MSIKPLFCYYTQSSWSREGLGIVPDDRNLELLTPDERVEALRLQEELYRHANNGSASSNDSAAHFPSNSEREWAMDVGIGSPPRGWHPA